MNDPIGYIPGHCQLPRLFAAPLRSASVLVLTLLLMAFLAACGGDAAGPDETTDTTRPTEESGSTGDSQAAPATAPDGTRHPTVESDSTATPEAAQTTTPADTPQPAETEGPTETERRADTEQPTEPGTPAETETDHVEYMLQLLALNNTDEFWFVDLKSISADPELALLSANLEDTWNGWNAETSTEMGLTIQDATFVVSLPSSGVFLGGIQEPEALQATLTEKGYQQEDISGVVRWVGSSEDNWESFTFLAHGVVLVTGIAETTTYFLESASCFIIHGWCGPEDLWQEYRRYQTNEVDIGSMDDVASQIRDNLLYYFGASAGLSDEGYQFTLAKAGTAELAVEHKIGFSDEEDLESYLEDEAQSQTVAEALAPGCNGHELVQSGQKIIITAVCTADSIDLRYANYFLAIN